MLKTIPDVNKKKKKRKKRKEKKDIGGRKAPLHIRIFNSNIRIKKKNTIRMTNNFEVFE